MRNLTLLTTVLLSSSMPATTAAAQTQPQSHRCKSLEQSLAECKTIGVSTSAASGGLNLLSKDYPIMPIEKTAAGVFPSHLVIGPADLDNPQIFALLRRSYRVARPSPSSDAGRFAARNSLNNLSVGSQIEFRTQRKWMNLHDGNKKETTYLIQQVTPG